MGRRQDEYRATLLGAKAARLEDALTRAATQFRALETFHAEAARISKELADAADAALARPQTVTPEPDGWIECTLCGDAYYGDKEGCPNRDRRCPMKGQNPEPSREGQ